MDGPARRKAGADGDGTEAVQKEAAQVRKYAVCESCGERWNVSIGLDTSRMYICPRCDARMAGRSWYYGSLPERG